MRLIFYERQIVDQWKDRNVLRWKKLDVAPERDKTAAQIMLINVVIQDFADRGEALKFCRLFEFQFWRIKDDPIPGVHPFKRRRLPMIRLDESAGNSALKVIL